MLLREKYISLTKKIFRLHGAVQIDTPVFELREVLQNKYGEDSKLIYDLSDEMSSETGEKLSLRYDLSVPFARYIASNNVQQIKRFHIGKVYRRDRPMMERGRFREFYQCDFDVAGAYPVMVADAEVLVVMMELFDCLAGVSEMHGRVLSSYKIKISNRVILDSVFKVCGVPDDMLRAICSAVDKLDKESWENVYKEMVVDKGLDSSVADKIERFVNMKGTPEQVVELLRAEKDVYELCGDVVEDMEKLFRLVGCMRGEKKVPLSFDLSLARGLDYYTGVIFEAVLTDKDINLGSIGAGGRYDNLVGTFRKNSIPCVGCSLGIERIMNILLKAAEKDAKARGKTLRGNETEVMACSAAKGSAGMEMRMRVAAEFWQSDMACEFCYNENWNVGKQIGAAERGGASVVVVVGEDEAARGVVKIKILERAEEEEVARENMVEYVKTVLADVRGA